MVTHDEIRRIALALPDVVEDVGRFAFEVQNKGKSKGFAWSWMERVDPKKPKVANPDVLAVRVPDLVEKDVLLEADPEKFFTEPHYNGYPAILVRLAAIDADELAELLTDAWRCTAPRKTVTAFDAANRPQ